MATNDRPAVGIRHVTVVPENFDPERPRTGAALAATDEDGQ